jgi:Ca2+-binding EF-hand superfamily protein
MADDTLVVKWDEYVDFQRNTQEFAIGQKKSKALAQAMKSGNVDQHLRAREKRAFDKKVLPRQKSRKKVRVKPKRSPTVVAFGDTAEELSGTENFASSTVDTISGPPVDTISGPPSSLLRIDPSFKQGKAFVPGAHRAAKIQSATQKKKETERIPTPSNARKTMSTAQLLRAKAMEKRAKMWADLKERQLAKARKKMQRTWLQKKLKHVYEVYIIKRAILFDETNRDFLSVNICIKEVAYRQRDLRTFRVAFDNYDLDFSGEIDYIEFAMMCESFTQTNNNLMGKYLNAIFEIYDIDQSGTFEFHEFIQMCSCYCMYRYGDIIEFCFKTFDTDGSGFYTEDEFQDLALSLAGEEPMFPGNFQTALQQFDADGDGLISFAEFKNMCRSYPSIFHPAVE